nr:protein NATD1-like [Onthophagus taurus]
MVTMVTRLSFLFLCNCQFSNNKKHLPKIQQFMLKLGCSRGNDWGIIRYTIEYGILNLTSTEIPQQYRGKGHSYVLAEKTFDYIIEQQWRMKLTCAFLQDFFKKNCDKYHPYVLEHPWKFRA